VKHFILLITWLLVGCLQAVLVPNVDSITMADGKTLAADVYIPNGMTKGPVILIQTPYNRQAYRYGGLPLGIGMNLQNSAYIFVITDWRGFYGSAKSAYIGSPDRTADAYATVEWIAAQSWSNGKVGTWGPSALGKIQFQTAKRQPPHLTCICPLVAAPQFNYTEYYPNGCLRTEYVEQLDQLGFGLSNFLLSHPYKDNVWNYTETFNTYPDSIQVPCLMIGGWYDHNTDLMLDFFGQLQQKSPLNVRDKHRLIMGPWAHGGHGTAKVGSKNQGELNYPNAENYSDSMALMFFDYYLRGLNNMWRNTSAFTCYDLGSMSWTKSSQWPEVTTSINTWYFNKNGRLTGAKPQANQDSLKYQFNPIQPSNTLGGSTLRTDLAQGPYDQRPIEDNLTAFSFETDALTDFVALSGAVKVHLKVSSDQLDTDFDVRLVDVYPDGRSMLLNDAAYRMRFRNGFTAAAVSMMQAGKVYDCTITLPNTNNVFLKGHKIKIILSSSNYPKYNRNMNNGAEMYPGKSTDSLLNPLTANNVIYMNAVQSSYIEMPCKPNISSLEADHLKAYSIYPVPVSNTLTINIDNIQQNAYYQLYNAYGQCISSGLLKDQTLDCSSLQAGQYWINIQGQFLRFIKL
jgi:hypothetical protein